MIGKTISHYKILSKSSVKVAWGWCIKSRTWFFSKREVNKKIKDGDWNLRVADDNYKINYNTIRYSEDHFSSPEQFLTIINIVNVFLLLNKIFCKNTFATPIDC